MATRTTIARLARSSPYWPVLTHPILRRVFPGLGISSLGDGMSVVAISWLAIELAPASQEGWWVSLALAANTLPAALGALLFGRLMHGRMGAQLAGWDAILRAIGFAMVPALYLMGALTLPVYVTVLAVSSLLRAWGNAGRFTLFAEVLPERDHLAANAVVSMLIELSTVVGPLLAALVIAWAGPEAALGVGAATFAVLALTYRFAVPAAARKRRNAVGSSRADGFRAILSQRALLGLLAMTFCYFFLFGPVLVAMPVYISTDLAASAGTLAVYYSAFGVGAALGGIIAGYLRNWALWPTTVGIVLGFGAAMLPLGLGAPVAVALVSFALAGLIWAPYMPVSTALFQRATTSDRLSPVLAARGAVMALAMPGGTVIGGPLVSLAGARGTLLFCAVATIVVGLVAAGCVLLSRRRLPAQTAVDSAGQVA